MTVTFNRRSTDPQVIDTNYFMYDIEDEVRIISFIGAHPVGKIITCYTSDKHNHPSAPHKRYVVVCGQDAKRSVIDVSEKELEHV